MAAAVLAVAAALAAGCAINPPLRVADAMPARAGAGVLLLDVPFHPQTEMQCGPAALATVLNASGVGITPDALAPQDERDPDHRERHAEGDSPLDPGLVLRHVQRLVLGDDEYPGA